MNDEKYTTAEQIEKLKLEIKNAKLSRSHKITKKKVGRIVNYVIFYGVLIFLLILLVSIQLSRYSNTAPQVFGYQLYQVKTGSMSPTLPIGAIILSKIPKDKTSLKKGDIITFEHNKSVVTHRIIEVINDNGIKYRTKGDNPANSPDPDLVPPEDIKAVLIFKIY